MAVDRVRIIYSFIYCIMLNTCRLVDSQNWFSLIFSLQFIYHPHRPDITALVGWT